MYRVQRTHGMHRERCVPCEFVRFRRLLHPGLGRRFAGFRLRRVGFSAQISVLIRMMTPYSLPYRGWGVRYNTEFWPFDGPS